ncbi:MAG: DUF4394 domain-containing protein [Bacteroidota bacterium]
MKTINSYLFKLGMLCAAATLALSSCTKNTGNSPFTPADDSITGPDVALFALTSTNQLLSLNAKNPAATTPVSITGLAANETILGIDFRPATGQLYGVSSTSSIYTINTTTGAARIVGAGPFTPVIGSNVLGFDFNPTVDRIRLVTSSGQNLRLHPETGAVAAVDGVINGATNASITSAGYTQNKAGASATVLYVIDINNDKLYKQDPPNDGKLVEIGAIGFDIQQAADFDISPSGVAIAALKKGGVTSLYNIDLTTGKATRIKNDLTGNIIGLAIPTEPVAYAISSTNEFVVFNPITGASVAKAISGLQPNETILGLDFRPATGQLYGLGSTSRIYVFNTSSGAAVAAGIAPFATLLAGTDFGFDFNPTVDRIRIISNTGQSLRVVPTDGTVAAVDGVLNPGTPFVTAAAYTNNVAGATTTTLFDIDTQTNKLYKQDPPNAGTLVEVGSLGVTAAATNGFDIGSTSGTAYALLNVGGTTKVYTINLTTGAATAGATVSGTFKAMTVGLGF